MNIVPLPTAPMQLLLHRLADQFEFGKLPMPERVIIVAETDAGEMTIYSLGKAIDIARSIGLLELAKMNLAFVTTDDDTNTCAS